MPPATKDTLPPAIALLSNGRYGLMVTAAGAGYSTSQGLHVNRWCEDEVRVELG
jgi:Glycosyltransferase family 36